MMPIVTKKRHTDQETGQSVEGLSFEAHGFSTHIFILLSDWEMVFADDERESNPTSFKFLQMAHAWKNSQTKKTGTSAMLSGFTAPAEARPANHQAHSNTAGSADDMAVEDASSDVASSHGGGD
jgi:crooked neck